MFDIGFSEIVVIAVVALIVIGPEKLPKTARTLGHLFGRLQRYVSEVKADINRELELDELRKLQQQVQTAARDFETSMTSAVRDVQSGVRSVESELNAGATPAPAAEAQTPAAEAQTFPTGLIEPSAPSAPDAGPAAPEPPRQASLPGFDRG
jgi:sec-independent protein translocase protein TatB